MEAKYFIKLLESLQNLPTDSNFNEKNELEKSKIYVEEFVKKASSDALNRIQKSKKNVWELYKHPNGEIYYKNTETGEIRSDKPIGFDDKEIDNTKILSISKDKSAFFIVDSLAIKPSFANNNSKCIEMLLYYYESI